MSRSDLPSLDEQRRIVVHLDSFSLSRDLRQARLASHKGMISLREPHKGVISHKGTMLQSKTQEELSPSLRFALITLGRALRRGASQGMLRETRCYRPTGVAWRRGDRCCAIRGGSGV